MYFKIDNKKVSNNKITETVFLLINVMMIINKLQNSY